MSKYDIGDEFVIRIGDIFNNYVQGSVNKLNHLYKIDGFNSLVFDDNGLDKLQKVKVAEGLAMPYNEAYNKGLNDAWKSIIKMYDMTLEELKLIFGEDGYTWTQREFIEVIMKRHTPQEVLMKLEAYEKEQEEIKAGDVVYISDVANDLEEDDDDAYGVVTGIYTDHYEILMKNGDGISFTKDRIKKTGKHIDISSILEQIKEN